MAQFYAGWEVVEYDECVNLPVTAQTEEIQKITKILRKDRRLTIQKGTDMVNNNKETVRQCMHNELNMKKCLEIGPEKHLKVEGKANRFV